MAQNKDLVADAQTLLEENLSEKKSVESARRLLKLCLELRVSIGQHQLIEFAQILMASYFVVYFMHDCMTALVQSAFKSEKVSPEKCRNIMRPSTSGLGLV